MLMQHLGEGSTFDEGELAVPDCLDAGRSQQAVDHRQLAHDRARPEDGEKRRAPAPGFKLAKPQEFQTRRRPGCGTGPSEEACLGIRSVIVQT
jgi:hypothetical protein